ncbi:hypothetical protein GS885_02420 [Rhodococcus hoagii]|nr:hypothetical protein [Prescottella equi]NKR90305.1 hypothetical protein [Prescottella equi]NKS42291.1 hypothetical protein [Prescottella equi]NKT40023.1 hypothetical protein [Prescottella equi]NKT56887.1 hypothetical protein [Prescottella equi]
MDSKSVSQAAEDGSRRELLVALRSRVAKAVEDEQTPPRDLAALTRRLQEIAKEIDAIDAAESGDNSVVADTQDEAWDDSSI